MNDKKGLIVGLVIVAALFALAFPWGRRVMVELAVQERVLDLGRFPDANKIASLRDELAAVPPKYWVDPGKVKVEVAVEERNMGIGGVWLYVVSKVDYGQTIKRDHRIETSITPDFYESLAEQGVEVTKVVAEGEGDDDE